MLFRSRYNGCQKSCAQTWYRAQNIILSGWSAGGWSSLILQSRYPDKILGTIAFNPAFAGPKNEWQKKFPEWGAFREHQLNEFNKANTINAIVFAHNDDVFEDPKTLSFFTSYIFIRLKPKVSLTIILSKYILSLSLK